MRIQFIPFRPSEQGQLLPPIPAVKNLPEWYKQKKPLVGDSKKHRAYSDNTKNVTVKWCNPFGDALGSGYFLLLDNDVQVTIEGGEQNWVWFRGGADFISQHSKEQISPELIPKGYNPQPWKFMNQWGIKTPAGYSVLFTHPMNRTELPFLTLSGVVDTDDYNQPVNFPFVLRADFEGIIEAGTPIAQVVPFKRDSWAADVQEFDPEIAAGILGRYSRKIFRPYKLGYWKRKEYK
jgi:hypothetical protein